MTALNTPELFLEECRDECVREREGGEREKSKRGERGGERETET